MSYWDTSALVKLSVAEPDSLQFASLASIAFRIVTASITAFELRTVFRRLEAEGFLAAGEAVTLSSEFELDLTSGRVVEHGVGPDVEREFGAVLERCFSATPPVFIRTNDALHLASAKVAGESEFVTADVRQRAAALLLGFAVLP